MNKIVYIVLSCCLIMHAFDILTLNKHNYELVDMQNQINILHELLNTEVLGATVDGPESVEEIDWSDADIQRTFYNSWGCFYDIPFSLDLQIYIGETAATHKVDRLLVFAIAAVESNYGVDDVNIMQINNYWQNNIRCTREIPENSIVKWDITDPYDNIHMAICILEYYQKMGYTGHTLLMCYNGNSGYANDLINKGIVQTDYSKKVMEIYSQLKADLAAQAF